MTDLSFDLYVNEIFVLLGQNGTGKTTLLQIVSGDYNPDSGEIISSPLEEFLSFFV